MYIKKATNAMPERRQAESIYRTLLSPREHHLNTATVGTLRLRHVLAEDGCKESQVALAKSLLTAPSNSSDERAYNAQLAVYWLLEAVKTGQDEAFLLLEHCANIGVGINAVNISEVEKCLKFSEEEKISRRVAFSIFRAIMSDTEELIPSDIFRDKIDLIFQEKIPEKLPPESSDPSPPLIENVCQSKLDETSLRYQKHVSFSEVVNSVQSCLEGNVPLVSLKQVTHYSEYKKWLSTRYIHIIWDMVLMSIEKLFQSLSSMVLSLSILIMCVLLEISGSLSVSGSEVSHLIEKYKLLLITSYGFITMLSCTCFVVSLSFGGDNLKRWLHLIKFFEPNIKSKEIERKYLSKSICPLLVFLLTSFVYIALLPTNMNSVAFIDIGILCFVLMVFVDRTISYQRYYINVSLILNALTCLYKSNILQNSFNNVLSYLDLKIDYELGANLHMHVSFISCLTLPFVLPYLYIKMSLGKEKKFWHLVLLPHLMTLIWMNLACFHLSNSTTTQQFFSVLSWLVILVLSNYTGVLFTFLFYILMNVSRTNDFFRVEFFLLILGLIVLYFICLVFLKKFKISHESKILSVIICLTFLILSYQAAKPQTAEIEDKSTIIPWEKYQTYCHHHAWYRTNTAEVQISCLPLKGRKISLDGTVTSIDMIQVRNNMELIASVLPEPFYSWFACTFGENLSCNENELSKSEKEKCKMLETLGLNQCHLHNWDVYKYQITIEVSSRTSPEVLLITDHPCSSFIRSLKEGDTVHAIGRLDSKIGSSSPILLLEKAQCSSCYSNTECNIRPAQLIKTDYSFSAKNIVWFYLSPLIHYEVK